MYLAIYPCICMHMYLSVYPASKRHVKLQNRLQWRQQNFLTLLTSKCASCHNSVHFFSHLDVMCFAAQRRALFRSLSFQKWSKNGPRRLCFVHMYLDMCSALQRRATFHLSYGESWLRSRRFSEPHFAPSGTTK